MRSSCCASVEATATHAASWSNGTWRVSSPSRVGSSATRSDAEDVAQETFARVWTSAASWRPTARFTTWLHRVALNLCLDRLPAAPRGAARRRARSRSIPAPSARASTGGSDVTRVVGREIAALPERQRVALALCHYQGLRNDEAAEIMEVTVDALESLLARARRTLRDRLRPVAAELLGA